MLSEVAGLVFYDARSAFNGLTVILSYIMIPLENYCSGAFVFDPVVPLSIEYVSAPVIGDRMLACPEASCRFDVLSEFIAVLYLIYHNFIFNF